MVVRLLGKGKGVGGRCGRDPRVGVGRRGKGKGLFCSDDDGFPERWRARGRWIPAEASGVAVVGGVDDVAAERVELGDVGV